jgi:hypothetical protein
MNKIKLTEDITKIIYKNSVDDSYYLKIKFEKVDPIINQIVDLFDADKFIPEKGIRVLSGRIPNYKFLMSKSEFLIPKNSYKIIDDGESITISNPDIDYMKQTYKFHLVNNWKKTHFISEIPPGEYLIDEDESNEDQIKIYYK